VTPGERPNRRAAILAGGRGSRLGGRKALAEVAGLPLISYPLSAAAAAGLDPFVVAKPHSPLPELDFEVVHEPERPSHPLAGALTALRAVKNPVLLLGCDMPFLTGELLAWLANQEPPAVAVVGGRLQPLLGIYGESAEPSFTEALAAEAPFREAVDRLAPRKLGDEELQRFGDPARLAFSVDSPDDLTLASRLLDG
jgi:molybdenum cofactor guanylyltransferase